MSDGYLGTQDAGSTTTDFNAASFLVQNELAKINTAIPGEVVRGAYDKDDKDIPPGTIGPVGYVDVQPLVNQIDGYGKAMPHGTVYHLSYYRYQGANGAIISDPVKGDIGLIVVSNRDTSSVRATDKQANPGSRRRFDLADGTFFGQTQAKKPVQWTTFTDKGLEIQDRNGNKIVKSPEGIVVTDKNQNVVTMVPAGMKLTTKSGNVLDLLLALTGVTGIGSIIPQQFAAVASIVGNVLSVTRLTAGSIFPGSALTALGGTVGAIVSQITGTPNGVGTYLLDVAGQVIASTAIGGSYGLLSLGTVTGGLFKVGDMLSGLSTSTALTSLVSGTGGMGSVFAVNPSQTAPSQTFSAATGIINLYDKNGNKIVSSPTGMTMTDVNANVIDMGADGVRINGCLITKEGNVVTKIGVNLDLHVHGGVDAGPSNTGPPV